MRCVKDKMGDKVNIEIFSGLWFFGWLFTWGYVGLTSWKVVWAIVIWAYYLGDFLKGVIV